MTRLLKWNTADVLPLIEEVRRGKESISGLDSQGYSGSVV